MGVLIARTQSAAMLAALEAADLLVGDGEEPAGSGWADGPGLSQFRPYAVLWGLPGGSTGGTLANPDEDAQTLYQVTCVGSTREQAELLGDRARVALTTPGAVVITDEDDTRTIQAVRLDQLGGCRRDDDIQPVLWFTGDRYRVLSTP